MRKAMIAQTCAVTSLGNTLAQTFKALLNKESGIKELTRFSTHNYKSKYASFIKDIEKPDDRSLFLNLTDMIIDQLTDIPEETVLITATTKACIDLFEKENNKITSFNKYINPSVFPEYIKTRLNLKNSAMNISSACASSTIALIKGAQMIVNGRADTVLVFGADITSEFVFSGFSALNALSDKPTKPFDINRNGLTLGEGGAALLLVADDFAREHNISCSASIKGFGISNDATHITAPAKDGRGLINAINKSLSCFKNYSETETGIKPSQIGAISCHGTGTIYNDLMELKALQHVFDNKKIPANSIKGAIGHTLGGAGAIEVAIGSLILNQKILPGTSGFQSPEEGAKNYISSENETISKKYLLSTNSGFGGTNAALILKREKI
ncbi:beta-ketoacyl-[acyl-carrier-protein] synthase family protein [bacterium]|nr:beta-ketoacyl-[acyl-carrier-protein] synthase family protein [bacterium]